MVEKGVKRAVLGIKHLLPHVDLQSNPDVLRGHEGCKKCFCHGKQGLACALLRRLAAPSAHAQIQISKGVIAITPCSFAGCTTIGHRKVRCGVSQHACAAGGKHLFASFVGDGEHGIGELSTQRGHVDRLVKLTGIENDKMGHGLQPGSNFVTLRLAGHRSREVLTVLWCDLEHRVELPRT